MITISIISPRVSLEAIDRVIEKNHFECTFHKYVYQSLEEIEQIYYQCKDHCDVIFCSGELGYHHLINIKNLQKPCTFVSYEDKHFLAIALDFVIKHPDISLNRVYCDFLTPLNHYLGADHYIEASHMPYCVESFHYVYETLLGRAKELWDAGKIDMVLTRSTNRLSYFDQMGIPYIHILPSDEMIAESINHAINMTKLSMNAPQYKICIMIKMEYPETLPVQDQEYLQITLHKYLLDFRKENGLNFSVQTISNRFRLIANTDNERDVTKTLRKLISRLNSKGNLEFRLGAGISPTLDQSCYQAESALHESIRYGKNDGFIMDSHSSAFTGPLSIAHTLNYSYDNKKATEYSRQNGINEGNLLKITGLFNMNPEQILTASSLSRWLNITTRSCNRILQQLIDSQLIEEIEPLKLPGKGRPTRQYQFISENCRNILF